MNNNKNLLLAIALAAAVLFGWQYFVATPAMKAEQARQAALTHQAKAASAARRRRAPARRNCPASPPANRHLSREAALKAGGARVAIDTPMVDGSILLKGARFDDLRLKKYRETVDPKSPGDRAARAQEHRLSLLRRVRLGRRRQQRRARRQQRMAPDRRRHACRPAIR